MNTLKLDITELEIEDKQNQISERNYDRYFDYNETFKSSIILPTVSNYRTINYSEVSSPFALVVISDKLINVKVNGNEITNTKMVLMNTAINSLQIANVDDSSAVVTIYIWGKQE